MNPSVVLKIKKMIFNSVFNPFREGFFVLPFTLMDVVFAHNYYHIVKHGKFLRQNIIIV